MGLLFFLGNWMFPSLVTSRRAVGFLLLLSAAAGLTLSLWWKVAVGEEDYRVSIVLLLGAALSGFVGSLSVLAMFPFAVEFRHPTYVTLVGFGMGIFLWSHLFVKTLLLRTCF